MNTKKICVLAIIAAVLVASFSVIYWSVSSGLTNETNESSNTIQIVDLSNRTVTLTVPVETVVIADQNTVNAFAAVGGTAFLDSVIGLSTDFRTNYPDQYDAYLNAYPELNDITPVGSLLDSSFSVETVVSLNPDVLILPSWAKDYNTLPDLSALDAANIPYVFVDFFLNPYSGDSYSKSVSLLGTILGQEERANSIIDFYNNQLNAVFDVLNTLNDSYAAPTVYIEWPNTGITTYGVTMVNTGMAIPLKYARGDNIAEGVVTKQGILSGEFLVVNNPDVIMFCLNSGDITTSSGSKVIGFDANPSTEEVQSVVTQYLEREGWSNLDAVKNGKVYFWYSGLSFSIDNFAALQYMSKWLYPELFTDLDPLQNLQTFYNDFMPIPLNGTWTFQ
jgi:iron complex transport system substrate-binding protein